MYWETNERAHVVDLAAEWPDILRDRAEALHAAGRQQVSGANQKDLLIFAHLQGRKRDKKVDWVCRIETDSYFAPSNFRRFVRGGNKHGTPLDPSEPFFLGRLSYWQVSDSFRSHTT